MVTEESSSSTEKNRNNEITRETAEIMMQVWDRDGNGYTTVSEASRWFFSEAVLVKPHPSDSEKMLLRRKLAKELVTRARAAMLTYMKDVAVDHGGFIEKVNALGDQESNGKKMGVLDARSQKVSTQRSYQVD